MFPPTSWLCLALVEVQNRAAAWKYRMKVIKKGVGEEGWGEVQPRILEEAALHCEVLGLTRGYPPTTPTHASCFSSCQSREQTVNDLHLRPVYQLIF